MLRRSHRRQLNSQKSKALPTGGWSHPATALGIKSHDQVTILGIRYGNTIAKSVKDSWTGTLRAVRVQARKRYARTLCLATKNTLCTPMSSRKNLVSGTNPPTHQGTRATTDNRVHLVHLARCNISYTCDHATTP